MNDTCIYVGDIGTLLVLDTKSDISGATTFLIRYEAPDETTGFFTGSLSGTDSVQYTTTITDFDQVGDWILQAYVEYAGGNKFYGCRISLEVKSHIS